MRRSTRTCACSSASSRPELAGPLAALIAREGLPPDYVAIVERWWRPLAARIAARQRAVGRGIVVGINGPQGSGKSTLALVLEVLLGEAGLRAGTLALDDLYLTRAERAELARTVAPLFATRGVPGTHDVALGIATLDALLEGVGATALPRFDKGVDDRACAGTLQAPLDVVLFEGWCVGATPEPDAALAEPANALEAADDADGRWRRHANTQLARPYRALFARIDLLVMLRPPGFAQVAEWRALQEAKLRARTGQGMDAPALARFMSHYERLTTHMLVELPARADVVVEIGADHRPWALEVRE